MRFSLPGFRKAPAGDGNGNGDGGTAAPAPPSAYAEWSACLDRLATGQEDETCLAQLYQGQLEWSGGVAPLFGARLHAELHRRLTLCSDRLSRDLASSPDESRFVRALLQVRQQLAFCHRLCQLPVLPEPTRTPLCADVQTFADRSQHSLLESARRDTSGRLASVLRNNPLNRYDTTPPLADAPQTGARRRQILS